MTHDTATDPVVEQVREKLKQRSEAGQRKYGTTLQRTDLSTGDWITHLQEELLDAANYCQVLINKRNQSRDFHQQARKPAFATWEHGNLARLANDLWDDNLRLRDQNEALRRQVADDWK